MWHSKVDLNQIIIRRFILDDLPQVVRIIDRTLTERYSLEIYHSIYKAWPEGFIVSLIGNKIVGVLASAKNSIYEARILMFSVDTPYQGKGIGSLLLKHFENICREEGIRAIRLEVRISNDSAIKFYERNGFVIINMINSYYSNGESAYIMWKMLE
ncbi:MAG: GNAT family N-acetyltransferase [Thermoplasmata archaeon]|nr:N-acetyltransferase [Thermoplasmata archaeon]